MSERVAQFRRPRAAPAPKAPAYAEVGQTTRAAADALVRRASDISRLMSGSFTGGAAHARLPGLIAAARLALDELDGAAS